jgi:leader peptidase (prepilin peptidase)/N-methyltransferase
MPPVPEPLASAFALAFGLIAGSFLNVCVYRLPVGESVVSPRSRCPQCKVPIRWYQNIPILSWIALRGACGSCSTRISWRYPFVEALAGATVWFFWWWFGATVAFPIATGFTLALVVLFFTDYDHQLLPDAVTLSGCGVGLAVSWLNPFLGAEPGWPRVWAACAGAALGSGLLWAVGAVYGKLRGVEAMGMGDVKMMAMVGQAALRLLPSSGGAGGFAVWPTRGSGLLRFPEGFLTFRRREPGAGCRSLPPLRKNHR